MFELEIRDSEVYPQSRFEHRSFSSARRASETEGQFYSIYLLACPRVHVDVKAFTPDERVFEPVGGGTELAHGKQVRIGRAVGKSKLKAARKCGSYRCGYYPRR